MKENELKDMHQIGSITQNIEDAIVVKAIELAETSYVVNEMGLYSGKAGILLTLHHLAHNFKIDSPLVRKAIKYLQEDISENAGSTDNSFTNGIFGIGWAVNTLYEYGYITEGETEVLNSFDDELYKLVMYQKSATPDLETGTMGRINYYLKRINEDLKIANKYRYVCNYECLMLLVDDLINENENIIKQLESGEPGLQLLMNDGKYYSTVFNLLSILVKKNIHPQITERQQLQFLRAFLNYFDFIKTRKDLLYTKEKIYWNTISLLNCLLKIASKHKAVEKRLNCGQSFFQQINWLLYPFKDVKELAIQFSFSHFNNYSTAENAIKKIIAGYNSNYEGICWGIKGHAGFLYLINGLKNKEFNVINDAFLI